MLHLQQDYILLVKKGQTFRCAIYTLRMTYMYQVLIHEHQESYTYIKIRHINIKAHIYMLNDATLTSRFFSYMYIKFPLSILHDS